MGEIEKGNESFLDGRFNDAIRHYSTVLSIIPNDPVVLWYALSALKNINLDFSSILGE